MILKIAVCDDDSKDRQLIVSFIKSAAPCCEIISYRSGEELLWDVESGVHFDILLLDIYMNGISGIETAKRVRVLIPDALLIFISSSDDFYRESYDLYAFNYLIKPVSGEKLMQVLTLAIENKKKDTDQIIQVFFNNNLHKVRCSQLVYLYSDRHIVNLCLKNGETLKSYGKMDDFVSQLPSKGFMRCHQSYIVNLNHVSAMTTSRIELDGVSVPMSKKYSKQARDMYRLHMFGDF